MMGPELLTPDIIKMAKSLKRQIVEITPYYICGTDSIASTFSIIYLDGSIQVSDDLYFFGMNNELTKYDVYLQNMYSYERYKPKMDYLRATCQSIESRELLYQVDRLTEQEYEIPGFTESLRMKAKEGTKFVHPEFSNLIMASSGVIHPINKTDIVNVSAFEYDEISWLMKFEIEKKKYKIYEYIRFLYLMPE